MFNWDRKYSAIGAYQVSTAGENPGYDLEEYPDLIIKMLCYKDYKIIVNQFII